ncbi:hypothetical protein E2C01_010922 [Portunus trituberculatus]|uniref:Secreted protein n=1 Tax=Portunus trituberculatus TaxID=210409 RepID=A0A5B7DA22_PORTR|nr:hypothetical protein [Portunus trituberculatus]
MDGTRLGCSTVVTQLWLVSLTDPVALSPDDITQTTAVVVPVVVIHVCVTEWMAELSTPRVVGCITVRYLKAKKRAHQQASSLH